MHLRNFTPLTVGFLLLMLCMVIGAIDRTFFRHKPNQLPASTAQQGQSQATRQQDPDTAAHSEQRDALNLLGEAEANIDEALRQIDVWQTEIEPLQDNSAGQVVGKDPKLAESLAYLLDQQRTSAERLLADRDRLGVLRENLERLAVGTRLAPAPPGEMLEIQEIHDRTSEASEQWQFAVSTAKAIVRKSQLPQSSEALTEEERPLPNPIQDTRDEQALAKLEKQRKEEAQWEQLKKEATSPEVLRTLAPFVTPRSLQPKLSGVVVRFEKTYEEAPMSLSRLEGMQVLEPTTHSLTMLARIGCDRDLPQPRWSFPTEPHARTEETKSFLAKAQGMLIQYGDALVKTGHLSP